MKSKITVLDAPSNLGLRPSWPDHLPGVWQLPMVLREKGLLELLNASDAGKVTPPEYSNDPDPHTGFRNSRKIADYSKILAGRITDILLEGCFPLVLGGDCSILLGSMLALRSLGEYGLCFIDGHDDFAYPRSRDRFGFYTAAGLDLALATGYGPDELVNIADLGPYVKPFNVVAFGFYNDPVDKADFETEAILQTEIAIWDIERIRSVGAHQAAISALWHLERSNIKGFWIHLDADVLDQTVMPAVDSPNPLGLLYDELIEILHILIESDACIGMEITIFDPELDPDGKRASEFVSAVVKSFDVQI